MRLNTRKKSPFIKRTAPENRLTDGRLGWIGSIDFFFHLLHGFCFLIYSPVLVHVSVCSYQTIFFNLLSIATIIDKILYENNI